MPKRPRADDEVGYCPLQLKTHVGIKEVNLGVNKEKNMKAVYAHTLNLMLQGQKAYYTNQVSSNGHGCSDGQPHRDGIGLQQQQLMPGQLQLNMTGQLGLNKSEGQACGNPLEDRPACRVCLKGGESRMLATCPYCEHNICQPCSRQCENCNDFYCQFCSVLNYDALHERIFCLNCLA